jgi:hypothetical protein
MSAGKSHLTSGAQSALEKQLWSSIQNIPTPCNIEILHDIEIPQWFHPARIWGNKTYTILYAVNSIIRNIGYDIVYNNVYDILPDVTVVPLDSCS